MIERIIDFSIRRRWLILLVTLAAAATGFWSLTKLPIDAVPDVTNVQVQINAVAPALTPVEIEKQVSVVVEIKLGPISTRLGEIYWWAVEYAKPGELAPVHDGQPGWQSDGTYLTPEGERLSDDF